MRGVEKEGRSGAGPEVEEKATEVVVFGFRFGFVTPPGK